MSTKLAVRYPEKVQSLILIDSLGFFMPNWESIYNEALEGKNLFYIESAEDYEKFRDRIFYKKPKTNDFVLKYLIKEAMDNKDWYNKIFNELFDLEAIRKNEIGIDEISLLKSSCF
ncbi:hypothetical protein AKJ60_00450 [candidate division MSBL1 archaeon SCGC-AAA385M11]|nr:hypothetical protein AKJ60_00450 [candidate division MSBL1 archaeon SCGC-AAA385M11]